MEKARGVALVVDRLWPPERPCEGLTPRVPAAPAGGPAAEYAVLVHYELHDGLPLISKWIKLRERGRERGHAPTLQQARCSPRSSRTASWSSSGRSRLRGVPALLHVETDLAFGGGMTARAAAPVSRWLPDPDYTTQVNYERKTPCLAGVPPPTRPGAGDRAGRSFESFRVFELLHD